MTNIIDETSNKLVFMSRKDLHDLGITFANSTLIVHEKKGKFPKRIPLSDRRVAWIASEVDQWIRQKMDEREEADHDEE